MFDHSSDHRSCSTLGLPVADVAAAERVAP
jgi:hypothetical protein